MEEGQWMRAIRRGEKRYFADIAEKYYDDIFRFCAYFTGSREDAYDLAQETFLRFIQYAQGYRERNLKGYLLTIAANVCRSQMRKKGKEKGLLIPLEACREADGRPGRRGLPETCGGGLQGYHRGIQGQYDADNAGYSRADVEEQCRVGDRQDSRPGIDVRGPRHGEDSRPEGGFRGPMCEEDRQDGCFGSGLLEQRHEEDMHSGVDVWGKRLEEGIQDTHFGAGIRERQHEEGKRGWNTGNSALGQCVGDGSQARLLPEQHAIERDIHDRLMDALAQLPDMQREAILLYYLQDMKYREISHMTEVSVSTVKSRVRQGMEKLRERLEREDFLD